MLIIWRGKPLISYRATVQLVAATTSDTGLTVRADENKYHEGVKVSGAQMAAINLSRHAFNGDWSYTTALRDRVFARARK